MKKNENFNSLIRTVFTRAHPLKKYGAYVLGAFGFLITPLGSLIDMNMQANEKGVSLKQAYIDMPQGTKNNIIGYSVLFPVICTLLAWAMSDKSQEKDEANYIVRRTLRKMARKDKQVKVTSDEAIIEDIADLLASYMTDADKKELADVAWDLNIEQKRAGFAGDYDSFKFAQVSAVKRAESVINGLFARNPELADLIKPIASGEALYDSRLFANAKSR